ncbi:hypothetical protein ACIA5D_36615 [Actinoplanes sp. NPDC051513]|uniref:hypothetical protein n=1 Tax=Actinoplanes sp. NPDC051513 TaxID=3363908 RepID=UPI0037A11916
MVEPDNHTAWIDRGGDTWVRVDDYPIGSYGIERWGPWWPLTDGPGWEPRALDGIGQPRPWDQVDEFHGPFTPAGPERTARAIERVRREVAS